uniref:Pro-neuregulin-2, membrane-bound isoform-like n=1 Tax=Geotrypetes seraphini TaxID=260995 RepID=A0A6P8SJQ6_GEOSA|nr:pro-neuregulin-2, membrane-bound isoform-like [Geotrypetes seraphini]
MSGGGASSPAPAGVCYPSPSVGSVRELAQRARVVVEGRVQPAPAGEEEERSETGEELSAAANWTSAAANASASSGNGSESASVRVRVQQVWAVKAGGLEKDSLISVLGDFGSCLRLKEDSRYLFFLEPTNSSSAFRASFPPLETGRNHKKEVGRALCRGCAYVYNYVHFEEFQALSTSTKSH